MVTHMKEKIKKIKYTNIFWLFLIGSIIGFVLEGLWSIIRTGHWENHSATVWGPFCIIYGIGAVVMYLLFMFLGNKKFGMQFICCMLAGSAVEYISSVFQQICFGTKSWDYSGHFFNLGGRISLQMTVIWGILGILFVRLIFPHLEILFTQLNRKINCAVCLLLTIFMIANLSITCLAILRWGERINGEAPSNRIEEILDERFDDDRMTKIYSNMRFLDKR